MLYNLTGLFWTLEKLMGPCLGSILDIGKFIGSLDNSEAQGLGTLENLTGPFGTLENLMGPFLDIRKFIGSLDKFQFNITAFEFCMRPLGLVLSLTTIVMLM